MGQANTAVTHQDRKTTMSFTFKIHAKNLPKMDKGLEGSSADPFFKLYVDDDKIYESDHVSNSLDPEWPEFTLERDVFGGLPKMATIKMKVKDHDWGNSDDSRGVCFFKIHEHEGPWESRQPIVLLNDGEEEIGGEIYVQVDEN